MTVCIWNENYNSRSSGNLFIGFQVDLIINTISLDMQRKLILFYEKTLQRMYP